MSMKDFKKNAKQEKTVNNVHLSVPSTLYSWDVVKIVHSALTGYVHV